MLNQNKIQDYKLKIYKSAKYKIRNIQIGKSKL